MVPAVLHWSSGKDSAFALRRVRQEARFEVRALLTTVSEQYERVAVHGVRRALLRAQAAALGLPLVEVPLPAKCSNEDYERRMRAALARLHDDGLVDHLFGDLHLADIRAYREKLFAAQGLKAHFPLWGEATAPLARKMVAQGLAARVVVLDPARLSRSLAGAAFDENFLSALPEGVDPCGEKGEFHTLVLDSPDFGQPLKVEQGESVERDGFLYQDFALQTSSASAGMGWEPQAKT